MDAELLGPLAVLALVDSTSVGTLLVPVWLMLAPGRLHAGRIMLYLATVAALYLLLGAAILTGLLTFAEPLRSVVDSTPARVVQLVAGVVLLVVALTAWPWTRAGREARAARQAARRTARGPGRLQRWRERATDGNAPPFALLMLALTATAVEAASMLPYLAALGLLAAAGPPLPQTGLILAGYCLLMIIPALILLLARTVFHERIAPPLRRMESWTARNSGELTAWTLAILGFLVVSDAVQALDLG